MKEEKIQAYIELVDKVLWMYKETSCSISQIARHYDISHTKVSNIIEGKHPKYY